MIIGGRSSKMFGSISVLMVVLMCSHLPRLHRNCNHISSGRRFTFFAHRTWKKSFISPWFSCQLQLHDSFGMILLTHHSARDGAPATSAGFQTTTKQAQVPAMLTHLRFYCFFVMFVVPRLFIMFLNWLYFFIFIYYPLIYFRSSIIF